MSKRVSPAVPAVPTEIQQRILGFSHKCEKCGLVSIKNKDRQSSLYGSFVFCDECLTFDKEIGDLESIGLTTDRFCDYYGITMESEHVNDSGRSCRIWNVGQTEHGVDIETSFKEFGVEVLCTVAHAKRQGDIVDIYASIVKNRGIYLIYLMVQINRKHA